MDVHDQADHAVAAFPRRRQCVTSALDAQPGSPGIAARSRALLPGLLLCLTVAMAAGFMSSQYGGPQVLYALLIGLAFGFVLFDK